MVTDTAVLCTFCYVDRLITSSETDKTHHEEGESKVQVEDEAWQGDCQEEIIPRQSEETQAEFEESHEGSQSEG